MILGYDKEAKRSRRGYITVIIQDGIEFAVLAHSPEKLEQVFNHITEGKVYFDAKRVNKVEIIKMKNS